MKTGVILNINNDLCEIYLVEDNQRAFAFLPDLIHRPPNLGQRYRIYPGNGKEVILC